MNPKVSVNLCCYNSEKYLRETLDSIVGQTYKDWELVIINDGSSDSTETIVSEYIKLGYPIKYYYQKNEGLAFSRNKALELSSGEYIAFIDHDDIWMPDKLKRQVPVLEGDPETDFLYSNYFVIKGGRRMLASRKRQPQGNVFEAFLYQYPVGILTTMIRKKSIDRLSGLFDRNLTLAEEYDLFMRILYRSKAAYQNEPLAAYRTHSDMSSIKFMEKWPDEMEYVFKKLGCLQQNFEEEYSAALEKGRLELEYMRAKMHMKRGDLIFARKEIAPYKFLQPRYLALYIFSHVPARLWNFVSHNFSKGAF